MQKAISEFNTKDSIRAGFKLRTRDAKAIITLLGFDKRLHVSSE